MFPHPLDGAFYRVYRADEHLEDLRPRVAGFELEQREAVIASLQSNKWDQGCHIDISMPVGMSIAVRIGEILYNLRTALEYLVFEIAKLDSKSPQDFTKFPIVDCPKDFRSWKKQARRKGINASHIAIFQRYQPYKGCNWSLALRELSNMDKHREFPELGGSGTIKIITFSDDPDFADHSLPQFRAPHPVSDEKMNMKIDFHAPISFKNSAPAMETLQEIKFGVTECLETFKPEF